MGILTLAHAAPMKFAFLGIVLAGRLMVLAQGFTLMFALQLSVDVSIVGTCPLFTRSEARCVAPFAINLHLHRMGCRDGVADHDENRAAYVDRPAADLPNHVVGRGGARDR